MSWMPLKKNFRKSSLQYVVNLKVNDTIADQEIIPFYGKEYVEEVM